MEVVSRKQKRELAFYKAAENGCFSTNCYLYKSEIKSLIKKGFYVVPESDSKTAVLCEVSWENAFDTKVPSLIASFIIGVMRTFPQNVSLAQQLFIIAKVSPIE